MNPFKRLLILMSFLSIRDGRLMVGDEIVNVNGRRLRGLTMHEAKTVLRNCCQSRDVDIVVARREEGEGADGRGGRWVWVLRGGGDGGGAGGRASVLLLRRRRAHGGVRSSESPRCSRRAGPHQFGMKTTYHFTEKDSD